MIAGHSPKLFRENEAYVILDKNGNVVSYETYKNNRRKTYWARRDGSVPDRDSVFETRKEAEEALSKCKRGGTVQKLMFIDTDISDCYEDGPANLLGYDFVDSRLWISSQDGEKRGYDYRKIKMVEE